MVSLDLNTNLCHVLDLSMFWKVHIENPCDLETGERHDTEEPSVGVPLPTKVQKICFGSHRALTLKVVDVNLPGKEVTHN